MTTYPDNEADWELTNFEKLYFFSAFHAFDYGLQIKIGLQETSKNRSICEESVLKKVLNYLKPYINYCFYKTFVENFQTASCAAALPEKAVNRETAALRDDSAGTKSRKSPNEHNRSGHSKTSKNGKVFYVRPTTVNSKKDT